MVAVPNHNPLRQYRRSGVQASARLKDTLELSVRLPGFVPLGSSKSCSCSHSFPSLVSVACCQPHIFLGYPKEKDYIYRMFLKVCCYNCSILLLVIVVNILLCLIYKCNFIIAVYVWENIVYLGLGTDGGLWTLLQILGCAPQWMRKVTVSRMDLNNLSPGSVPLFLHLSNGDTGGAYWEEEMSEFPQMLPTGLARRAQESLSLSFSACAVFSLLLGHSCLFFQA